MSFTCSNCKAGTRTLIAPGESTDGTLFCPSCFKQKKYTNCQLGQVVDKWVDKNGKTRRLTYGKSSEISDRRISRDDNTTVINYKTGKETKY